jgi:hypothetical protein
MREVVAAAESVRDRLKVCVLVCVRVWCVCVCVCVCERERERGREIGRGSVLATLFCCLAVREEVVASDFEYGR